MDTYQAVYDAVRSRINGFDSQSLIDRIARNFDFSHHAEIIRQEFLIVANEQMRPSVLFRPELSSNDIRYGNNEWVAHYGEKPYGGVQGIGTSPDEAMRDFDKKWIEKLEEDA